MTTIESRRRHTAQMHPRIGTSGSLGTRIDLDDVAKVYRVGDVDVPALREVNLHVNETAFVVILGPSGCGKTTLLNLIGALDVPTSGRVRIDGIDISDASRTEIRLQAAEREFHLPELQPVPRTHRPRERRVRS